MTAGAGLGLLGASVLGTQCASPVVIQVAEAPAEEQAASTAGQAASQMAQGEFNWMTWGDHFLPGQLEDIASKHKIQAKPALFADNSEALLKLQQVGGNQLDMVSADALWVRTFYDEGLIETMDLADFPVSQELYSIAREFPFWTVDGGYLAYPFGWSPTLIAYNPEYVSKPESWEFLWDPKYKGRIAMELQPFDVMSYMAKATGAAEPYNMTAAELDEAKQALKDLMPNILRFTEQNVETVQLMANETIWIGTANLGVEDRVKEAGGPEMISFIPKEGTVGFIDGEMIVANGTNRDVARAFFHEAMKAEWIAQNFLEFGRPLFNEAAYKLLVEQGHQERADRYFYNQPDIAVNMTLKGPAPRLEDYINAFNEAIAG
jgi:spermidine/putrescine-binding protein